MLFANEYFQRIIKFIRNQLVPCYILFDEGVLFLWTYPWKSAEIIIVPVWAIILFFLLVEFADASSPKFQINNSATREESLASDQVTYTDTYKQHYALDWAGVYSSRLDYQMKFYLDLNDTIFSQDVDTKEVIPSLEVIINNPTLNIKLALKDEIFYTNEFNRQRRDDLSIATNFEIIPSKDYFPPLRGVLNEQVIYQENLEDKTEKKNDFSTSYVIGDIIPVDAAWHETTTRDRMNDTRTDGSSWNFTLSYGQAFTPSIKFDESFKIEGERSNYSDYIKNVSTIELDKLLENKAKVSFAIFPSFESTLEYIYNKNFIEMSVDKTSSLAFTAYQTFLGLGDTKESITYTFEENDGLIEHTNISKTDFIITITGTPSKYLSHSANLNIVTENTLSNTVNDIKTKNYNFDMNFTLSPRPDTDLELAFSRASSYSNSNLESSDRTFKSNLNFDGEFLRIPGLTFNPSMTFSDSWALETDVLERERSLNLKFDYNPTYLENFNLKFQPTYAYTKSGNDIPDIEMKMDYEISFKLNIGSTQAEIINKGGFKNSFGDEITNGEFTLDKEFNALVEYQASRLVNTFLEYNYKEPFDQDKTDEASFNMQYGSGFMNVKLTLNNTRTFSAEKSVNRKYEFKFQKTF